MPTNEQVIRALYQAAEVQDVKKFVSLFADDGYLYDVSAGRKYHGNEVGRTVEIYAKAFPDMHRELYDFYVSGDVVIVELSLNGTHRGPLELPAGTIPATSKEIHAPCCDVFHLKDGKVQSFHCYTAATVLLGQLGVLPNLEAAFKRAQVGAGVLSSNQGNPEDALSMDEMLDNITLYWLTDTAASSARIYWQNSRGKPSGFSAGRIELPMAATIFPPELYRAPRRWAEAMWPHLFYWGEVDKGGHFAAFEQPMLFADELRKAFRSIRQG